MLQALANWIRRETAWIRLQLAGDEPPPPYRVAVGTVVLAVCPTIEDAVAERSALCRQYPGEIVQILHPEREF